MVNPSHNKATRAIFSPLIGLFPCFLAAAEGPTEDETPVLADQVLTETVVTASRVETPLEQVGSSITVITAEELQQQQTRLVSDILQEVPGVSVSRLGPTGSLTQVRIRGAEANQTLVIIDGVEVNDPATGSEFDFAHLLATDVERIEVLRGPQSALWGSDALGGVVNIITKRGQGPFKGWASLEGGSFGTWEAQGNASGSGERYNYSLSAAHYASDGISAAPGGSENDGYSNNTYFFKGGITPVENLTFNAVGRYVSGRTEYDPQDFAYPPTPTYGQIIDGDNEQSTDQFYGLLQGKLSLYDGRWEQVVNAGLTDTDNDFFEDGLRTSGNQGKRIKYDYQSNVYFDADNASHTLVLAAERQKETFKQRGGTPDDLSNQDQEMISYGYVAEYRLGLWDQLFLSGAARYDDNDRFQDKTTYRLTGAYVHPDSATRFHTSYGTGIKNPTFTELFGYYPGSFVGNPDLKPEQSRGWDVGVEQPFSDGDWVADLTYFHTDLEDEIITVFDSETFLSSVANEQGKSRRQGVELSLKANLWDGLSVTGAYTYTDSKDPDGAQEVRQPRNAASLDVNYRFLDNRANVNLGIVYQGERKDLDFTTLPSGQVTLDDYTLVNLRGTYRINDHWRVFGRIDNLLDTDYQDVFGYNTSGIGVYAGFEASL
ncbi:MAG: TonB-dependent receptor [Gammaproteobacteria bacterium]|nr:TonB-dependent receptor [Gammaproteobacteria bacterium]